MTTAAPNLAHPLWTNAHLKAYFICGSTTVCKLKKDPTFPRPVLIGGLKRYPADQVKAYAMAQQQPTTDTTGAAS